MITPQPSNFAFIGRVWPELLIHCRNAEQSAVSNPRVAGIEARFTLERLVDHIVEAYGLRSVSDWNLNDKLNHRSFKDRVNQRIHDKMNVLRRFGNDAAHNPDHIDPERAVRAVGQLFDILVWAAVNVARPPLERTKLPTFDRSIVYNAPKQRQRSQQEIAKLNQQLQKAAKEIETTKLLLTEREETWRQERKAHLDQIAAFKGQAEELAQARDQLEAELAQFRADIAANTRSIDTSNNFAISEAETRRDLIDPALAEAGFSVARGNLKTEFRLADGKGFVDYVLFGDDGRPYAIVEAKRAGKAIDAGRQQAEYYADELEKQFGLRPIIYYTNGHEIRLLDDAANLPGIGAGAGYPSRAVEGYATKDELYAMIRRRTQRQDLNTVSVDTQIAGRPYQITVLQAVAERFGAGHWRALLVMATGTGKTRTAIALVKQLAQAGWVKNVLFLADRRSLVKQAAEAFSEHLRDIPVVDLLRNQQGTGQVYCSTYQTMMKLLGSRFGTYQFDLIIVDEAHRSIYRRYSRIFDYFDSLLLGLTATPRCDVDHNTYALFQLNDGQPTANYSLDEAVDEKYLVPFKAFQCSSVILRDGVAYKDLSPEEQQQWENQDWGIDDDGLPLDIPLEVESEEINLKLYNKDTIRKVVGQVLRHGIKVAGADRIGKTIFFTRSKKHAQLVCDIIHETNPQVRAAVITHEVYDSLDLIDRFKASGKGSLDVAISVDMLDTGVDVPAVVNLVFFKPVYSNTKFWQMIGRGTRLAPNLFGKGLDKREFYVFDYCDNLRRFEDADRIMPTTGSQQRPLSERTFLRRIELASLLPADDPTRADLVSGLRNQLQTVPISSVLVRPEDRADLEHYLCADAWGSGTDIESAGKLAYLPFADDPEDEEQAKRFDYLMLTLQLALARGEALPTRHRDRVTNIARHLLSKTNVPRVADAASTLEHYSEDLWWEGITIADLELARRTLRTLVQFIDPGYRSEVVLDIEDELAEPAEFNLPTETANLSHSSVEDQLREVLEKHLDDLPIQRLRKMKPLTAMDLAALEEIIAGVEGVDEFRARIGDQSIVGFVRGLIGLDQEAVQEQFADFLSRSNLTAKQQEFLRRIIRVLAKTGSLTIGQLFEEPFKDLGNVFDVFPGDDTIVYDLKDRLDRIGRMDVAGGGVGEAG